MELPVEERHVAQAFMAECFWPGVTSQDVAAAAERLRRTSVASAPGAARHLGAILIPTDEIALFLFEASSITSAAELARHAALPCERILGVERLGAFLPPRRNNPTQ
jgi:hypothetical protein